MGEEEEQGRGQAGCVRGRVGCALPAHCFGPEGLCQRASAPHTDRQQLQRVADGADSSGRVGCGNASKKTTKGGGRRGASVVGSGAPLPLTVHYVGRGGLNQRTIVFACGVVRTSSGSLCLFLFLLCLIILRQCLSSI